MKAPVDGRIISPLLSELVCASTQGTINPLIYIKLGEWLVNCRNTHQPNLLLVRVCLLLVLGPYPTVFRAYYWFRIQGSLLVRLQIICGLGIILRLAVCKASALHTVLSCQPLPVSFWVTLFNPSLQIGTVITHLQYRFPPPIFESR